MSDSVRPYGQQPTRLLHSQDSLGKNTGVGYHFLLQPPYIIDQKKKKKKNPPFISEMSQVTEIKRFIKFSSWQTKNVLVKIKPLSLNISECSY